MDIITLALAKQYINSSLDKEIKWEKIHETPNTLEGYGITDGATKDEVNTLKNKMMGVYLFKGSVQTYGDLNTIINPDIGDVWNIVETGMNVAWTGTEWDSLGGPGVSTTISSFVNDAGYQTASEVSSAITAALNNLNGNGVSY